LSAVGGDDVTALFDERHDEVGARGAVMCRSIRVHKPANNYEHPHVEAQPEPKVSQTDSSGSNEAAPVDQARKTPPAQGRGQAKAGASQNAKVVETRRADGTRLVSESRNRGYIEHPITSKPGYVARTFVAGGRSYVQVYREASFQGFAYYSFVPAIRYSPLFYRWVSNPWPAPISFAWGWSGEPWYGYYGAYFTPAPAYSTYALWLTNYLLAQDLQLAYENLQQNGELTFPETADQTIALSPEIKQVISEEVEQQLAAEQAAAGGDAPPDPVPTLSTGAVPPALDPTQRVFVVSTSLDLPNGDSVCSLTPGDIILRTSDAMGADRTVGVSILSSKPGDCPINSLSKIDISTLQEMHNQFREQIYSGLGFLAANEDRRGLPKGPSARPISVTQKWAKADVKAQSEIMKQQQDDAQNP
jgi:hypothetical protein